MGKNFWPVYIIVAAVLLAATWKFAPAVGEKMPQATRDSIRDLVAKCMGRTVSEKKAGSAPAKHSRVEITPVGGNAQAPAVRPAVATKPAAAQPAAAPAKPAVASARPAAAAADDDDLPSLKGIMQEDAGTAKWGVLNQATTVEGLDGEVKGMVAGGRIFLIQSREKKGTKLWLVGNFSPTPMDEPVRVPAMNLYCFSGNPESLSQNQRNCLRMYYQLRGEALQCKAKVLRANADKSPFGKQAAAAKRAFDAKAREVEASSSGDNPRAKNELSQLREKYTSLLNQHREWKAANAALLKDPDKDPEYLKKLQEARAYAAPIAGMAF